MAKDDYHVIVYYLLSYLYHCLKTGKTPDRQFLALNMYPVVIPESYRAFIYGELSRKGLITGAICGKVPILGQGVTTVLKSFDHVQITAEGIDYLESNSAMTRAWKAIKDGGGLLLQVIGAFHS